MKRSLIPIAAAAALALVLSGCAGGSNGGANASKQLVIDTSFDLTTLDPSRMYEPTGMLILRGVYETPLRFSGSNADSIEPYLTDYEMNADNTVLTLTLRDGVAFGDGTPMTTDDIVFSYNRLIGIKGNPSVALDGITVAKVSDTQVTLTSETPKPQMPVILTNPSMGIVSAAEVEKNGGSMTPDDKAESYLNTNSVGSGPYTIEKSDLKSQVSLVRNEKYWGEAPAYDRIVFRNVQAPTQLINVKAGTANIVTDLSFDQTKDLPKNVTLTTEPSNQMLYVLLNQDPAISTITSNPKFLEAVRYGIDYDAILRLAGPDAVRVAGLIAPTIPGALPADEAVKTDVAKAKAALQESGYNGEAVKFSVANDKSVRGVSLLTVSEAIQAQMKELGINFQLDPSPITTALDPYRDGKQTSALWYVQPDYPHNFEYFSYFPGNQLAKRAGWPKGSDAQLEALETQITNEPSEDKRNELFQEAQRRLNEVGPFVGLLHPATNIVHSSSVDLTILPTGDFDITALVKK